MNKPFTGYFIAFSLGSLALITGACANRPSTSDPNPTAFEPTVKTSVAIPGFESLGSPSARRKADILSRYGPPASEERFYNERYTLLAYPVSGWKEKLLILFTDEELLGFARASSRAVLEGTMQHHARTANGNIVVYQSWFEGRTSYFRAQPAQLANAPQWKRNSGLPPPLTHDQVLTLVHEWLARTRPDSKTVPVVKDILESSSLPGSAFYVVEVRDFQAKDLTNLVVLMDGTIIPGEVDETL